MISLVGAGFINCHSCVFNNGSLCQFSTVAALLVDVADYGI